MHWTLTSHDAAQLVEALRSERPRTDLRKADGLGEDVRDHVEVAMENFRNAFRDEVVVGNRGARNGGKVKDKERAKDGVEGQLSIELYKSLKNLGPAVLTDPGFWRYVAVWEMFEFIQWRDGDKCKLQSFGAGTHNPTWDCVPKRMFVRARIAEQARGQKGAEALASVAGTDLWRSHVLRVRTGNCPALSAALVEAWDREDIRTKEVRDVAKRIKRLRSNLIYELMDEQQIEDVLSRQIAVARQKD
jgi:hypothetical protein